MAATPRRWRDMALAILAEETDPKPGVTERDCPPDPGAGRVLARLGLIPASAAEDSGRVQKALARLAEAGDGQPAAVREAVSRYAAGPCAAAPDCGACRLASRCPHPRRRPTLKDIPVDQRPRERLAQHGPDALTDAELLAILIRAGTPQASAVDLAHRLIRDFGGLRGLSERMPKELCAVDGIGPAKAAQVLAALTLARRVFAESIKPGDVFRGSRQVFEHFHPRLRGEKQEKFLAVLLDTKLRVLRTVPVSSGGLTGSAVRPRDVFRHALAESAAGVIFVHNHPSGDPTPSDVDIEVTHQLVEAGALLGVRVHDHVIVAEHGYVSLADDGKLR
jgi:DNA repair protein RadC